MLLLRLFRNPQLASAVSAACSDDEPASSEVGVLTKCFCLGRRSVAAYTQRRKLAVPPCIASLSLSHRSIAKDIVQACPKVQEA